MYLQNAIYIPSFHTNLISFRRMKKGGFSWDIDRNTLIKDGLEFCSVTDIEDQFVIEYRPVSDADIQQASAFAMTPKYYPKLSARPKKSEASAELWHLRTGHPGKDPIKHLKESTRGAIVHGDGLTTIECEACSLSKAHEIISRRPSDHPATQPFERVFFDIMHFTEAYNNHNFMHHLFDEYTKIHLIETTVHNGNGITLEILEYWYNLIKDRYKSCIKFIRLDNERTLQVQFETWCRNKNPPITIERTPPYVKESRGGAEPSGRVIDQMARTIRIHAHIPENLWPESVKTVKYLLMMLPTEALGWKTPYEFMHLYLKRRDLNNTALQKQNSQPSIAHLKAWGCRAYVHIPKDLRDRKRKLQHRAKIGYLVGYDSANVFRIWYPKENTVVPARDVTFNEKIFWDPSLVDPTELLVQVAPETGEIIESPLLQRDSHDITEISDDEESDEEQPSESQQQANPTNLQQHSLHMTQIPLKSTSELQLPTPEETPEPVSLPTASARAQAHFAGLSDVHNESGFHAAFATAVYTGKKARLYRDKLPPPPKSWKDIHKHLYKAEFIQAAQQEYKSLQNMRTFKEVEKPSGKQILPLLWVFTYKFDTDGYLTKFKARICVRGDLQ